MSKNINPNAIELENNKEYINISLTDIRLSFDLSSIESGFTMVKYMIRTIKDSIKHIKDLVAYKLD